MKTIRSIRIILPVLAVLALVSCENSSWNCLRGNGVLTEETRQLQSYDGVVTEGEYEIIYIPDTAYSVVLETDQNLLPYIRTRISGTTLVVDNGTRKCLRSDYPIRVYVHTPEIRLMSLVGSGLISAESVYGDKLRLEIEGSGNIDITGIDVLELAVLVTGSGDVDLWGKSDNADYTITGSGNIKARYLEASHCKAEISGSGTIYCHASESLNAVISGSGTIYYAGNPPNVNTYSSGSGSFVSISTP
jgi:hypothetical protein